MAIATAALAALQAPAAAAPPATVGCVPCNAAARLQDFVLSGAGELQLASAVPILCANASCAGDPATTGCHPLRLARCADLTSEDRRWNHTAVGGLLTSNNHALDFGVWSPGAPEQVGVGKWDPTMSWVHWKVDAAAKRISTKSDGGATCCLTGAGPAPPPAPAPAPPVPGEQPCRGELVEIASARLRIGVCVGDATVSNATYLSYLNTRTGSSSPWSENVVMVVGSLASNRPEQTFGSMLSTTSVEVVSSAGVRLWHAAKGGVLSRLNSSAIVISGVELRPPNVATPTAIETWRITATNAGIVWGLSRRYVAQAELCADRFPSLLLTKGIWSMFDSEQVMNMSSGAGFASATNSTSGAGVWFESIYPAHTRQVMRQSPTGVELQMQIANSSNFSLGVAMSGAGGARLGDDVRRVSAWQWIGGPTAAGATTVDRESGCDVWDFGHPQPAQAPGRAQAVGPGTPHLEQMLTLSVPEPPVAGSTSLASAPIEAFHLNTSDAELDSLAHDFASVFMMPRGGVYGNSAYSISCLHELSLLPQINGVFSSEPAGGFGDGHRHTTPHEVMATQLRLFAKTGLHDDPKAYLYMRHDWGGYENNTIRDQIPHFLLAFHHHAVNTGDKSMVRESWPAIEQVASYLLHDMRMAQDGIATVPGVSGLPGGYDPPVCQDPNQKICPSNWFDIVGFGGQDGLINALAIQAMKGLADLSEWLGNTTGAAHYRALHSRGVAAYNRALWDEERGAYGDWVDSSGRRRFYLYTWHNFVAIHAGIANATQATSIMEQVAAGYRTLQKNFSKPPEQTFCTPTNFIPADPRDLAEDGKGGPQTPYPAYENGACFMLMTGLELAALGLTGSPEAAYDRFALAMRKFNTTKLWSQNIRWDLGSPTVPEVGGGDVLQDSLVLLWGFIRGAFGAWPELGGVRVVGRPARQLGEGASHTFLHLGQVVTITVRGNRTVVEGAKVVYE